MKKISRTFHTVLSLITLGLMMPLSAQAATLDDVVKGIDRLRTELMSFVEAAKELYLEQLYEESPSYPTTVSANTAEASVGEALKAKMNELAMPAIKDILTQAEIEKNMRLLAALPASDSFQPSQTNQPFSVSGGQGKKIDLSEGDTYLYAGTLLAPLVYDMGKSEGKQPAGGAGGQNQNQNQKQSPKGPSAKAAFAFLQFAAGLGQPTGEINLSKLSERQREQIEASEVGRAYKVSMRSMTAARSVAIHILLRIYGKRMSVVGLGEAVGIPNQKDASPAEVERYIATRRSSDPEWYKAMSTASPAMLLREILNVLVEMQVSDYESGRSQERIEALLAIMELQSLEANKEAQKENEKALKELLGIR